MKKVPSRMPTFFPFLVCALLLLCWEIFCRGLSVPLYILPAPSAIFSAFLEVDYLRWLDHMWATLRVALLGFAISIVVSIPLAMLMVRFRFLAQTLFPFLIVVQATPVVAVAPLLIVILGTGDAPRLAITFLITFFPVVVATTTGMRQTPRELIDLSSSLGGGALKQIIEIRLPYAVPHIFSGLKVGITLSVIGAVIAEFVAAEKGLGYFVQFSTSYFKVPQAFSALFFLAVISLLLFQLIKVIQEVFFSWSIEEKHNQVT